MTASTPPPALTLDGLQSYVQEAFMRYYDTAYELRDDAVSNERHRLLREPGAVFAEPYLELLPTYETSERTLEDIFAALQLPECAGLVRAGLLPEGRQTWTHQEQALDASLRGRDVIVGTGTGSGKTEAFLLPILTRLVDESRAWTEAPEPDQAPWWRGSGPFRPQRYAETRPAGVRALLLYPMNALVEDQMVRLRVALDSPDARAWLAANRPGHRFYFGRYTGRTPLPGTLQTASTQRVDRLRELMRQAERRHHRLLRRVRDGELDESSRYFLPALDGAEMRARWDMQHRVPDILITNYSMLSIALSRSDEAPMIETTRQWLEASPEHVFTLVVDELHMYRGTAGTEVAYLLRRLLMALGLDRRPEQLRAIGTSASINNDADGRRFLTEFFGRTDPTGFDFIRANPAVPTGTDSLDALADPLLNRDTDPAVLPVDGSVRSALTRALAHQGVVRPRPLGDVAQRVFPSLDAERARRAFDRLIALLERQDPPVAQLRGHLFLRTLQGLWACADPRCRCVRDNERSGHRRVGALYTAPRFTCECGARVLELLYCQACGEVMLGGYVARSGPTEYLVSTMASLEELPDRPDRGRTAANYRVYWPTSRQPVVDRDWQRTGTRRGGDARTPRYRMRFVKAALAPGTGRLHRLPGQTCTGYVYQVEANGLEDRMPAMPTRCPSCGDDWEVRRQGPVEERQRSPIRTHGVGFDRANQVVTEALKRCLGSHLVVFSDSRQGAARVAANLELAHYLDLVRALIVAALTESSGDGPLIERFVDGDTSRECLDAFHRLEAANPTAALAVMKRRSGLPLDPTDKEVLRQTVRAQSGRPSLVDLRSDVEPQLLSLGVNPAGPTASLQDKNGIRWASLFTWDAQPVRDRSALVDQEGRQLLGDIRNALGGQVVTTVFAGGDRDMESLGIAYAVPARPVTIAGLSDDAAHQFACSVLRLLGRRRRVTWTSDGEQGWPSNVKTYATRVSQLAGLGDDGGHLLDALGEQIRFGPATSFRLLPDQVCLRAGGALTAYRCRVCRTKHLQPSAGVCVTCGTRLPRAGEPVGDTPQDYYAWLATKGTGPYRLHCEELTGQTDPLESQARQARFQGVFLDDLEQPLVDEVDVLSVTTTMEAGVDIGALRGVVMANMPPQRHNYQQRAGRTGRRSDHLSVALTISRGGRSHDEHYFADRDAITGDLPPQPFLDTASAPILRRAFAAEVLTRAFRAIAAHHDGFNGGRSVHGEYGTVETWNEDAALRATLRQELADRRVEWESVARALLVSVSVPGGNESSLAEWAACCLADELDQAAQRAQHGDLSEQLARAGMLPMFGFPTQVRLLYTRYPRPYGDANTLDRDAAIAISEFAPGAEVVKDKQVHTAVGVVDFVQYGNGRWEDRGQPLGPGRPVGVCRRCLGISSSDSASCPTCGATDPEFHVTDTVEPAAYRTSFRPRDYEQLDEPPAPAAQPRLALAGGQYQKRDGNALVRSADGDVVAVNDNHTTGYTFTEADEPHRGGTRRAPGLFELSLLTDQQRAQNVRLTRLTPVGAPRGPVAISARRHTDVLLVTVDHLAPGLSLAPDTVAGRGAWASLGYLLRNTAARLLDIGPDELQVGLHPQLRNGELIGEVFLADTLENGAGYAKRLGHVFEELLNEADRSATLLRAHRAGLPCDSSCHECLRDYRNRNWHPLLDWRLAVDLLDQLRGRPFDPDQHVERDMAAACAFARDFGLHVREAAVPVIVGSAGTCLGVIHPFEDPGSDQPTTRISTLRQDYPDTRLATSFDLLRRPGRLVGHLL